MSFSKAGNLSPDARHTHLELLFKDEKEGIRKLERKIRQIMADTFSESGGMGLRNIDSRIKYRGGTISYDTTPQHGTTINIELTI